MDTAEFKLLANRLENLLTVDLIATPVPLRLARGTRVSTIARQMEATGFDVLPVDASLHYYWAHSRAFGRDGGKPEMRPLSPDDLIGDSTAVVELPSLMVRQGRHFYFVLSSTRISGLVTYGDLDKRPVRLAFYALVNSVEQLLLEIVGRYHTKDQTWMDWLPPYDLTQVRRALNRAKSENVDIDPLNYVSLGGLIAIASSSPLMRPVLTGRLGTTDWTERLNHLRDRIRNRVAHPAHQLVSSPRDVSHLEQAREFAQLFLDRLS